jgi:hypothetical protein
MTTDTPASYAAWWRPHRGEAWVRLAAGPDYLGCWDAAVGALGARKGGDTLELRTGQDPAAPPPGSRKASYRPRRSLVIEDVPADAPPAPAAGQETGPPARVECSDH